jgi:hypothetical protein
MGTIILNMLAGLLLLCGVARANMVQTTQQNRGTDPIPPGARAAGFTTLALNSNFTQPMRSGWLGGCPNPGDGATVDLSDESGHTWWQGLWWMPQYLPCNIVQRQDPDFGGLVLVMPWVVDSTNFNGGRGASIETGAWNYGNPNYPNAEVVDFPNGHYLEVTARITPVLPAAFWAFVSWTSQGIANQNQAGLEEDVIQLDSGNLPNSDAAIHNWEQGGQGNFVWLGYGPPGLPQDFDPKQYHTYGLRATTNGRSIEFCSYIDNLFINCTGPGTTWSTTNASQRVFLNIQSSCDTWNYSGGCNGNDGITQITYVKSVRVWSCANWQNGDGHACDGSVRRRIR